MYNKSLKSNIMNQITYTITTFNEKYAKILLDSQNVYPNTII